MSESSGRPAQSLTTVFLTMAVTLGATTGPVKGAEWHASEAWLVVEFESPGAVRERVEEHLGQPAVGSLIRLLPSPAPEPVEGGPGESSASPPADLFATWHLDVQAPATVGYAWFPAAHALVGQVRDADAVAHHLGDQVAGEEMERVLDGIRLFPLGHVAAAARDDWLVVADDLQLAYEIAGTLPARLPEPMPQKNAGARREEADGVALPLRVGFRLDPARKAMAPLLVDRDVEAIATWPASGPLSRQRLAVGAILNRIPAQIALLSFHGFVTPAALVLKPAGIPRCPEASRLAAAGTPADERLSLAGSGSSFRAALLSLPFVVAALDIPQDAASFTSRRAVLDVAMAAEPGGRSQVQVTAGGHWLVAHSAEQPVSSVSDGFLLQWAGIRLSHDGDQAAGGSCLALTPAGLERAAALLNPAVVPRRPR